VLKAILAVALAALAFSGCGPRPTVVPAAACLTNLPPAGHAPQTAGMVLIKGGAFQMGARAMRLEEGPARTTRVGSFWIDRTEVTNADFARFVKATGYVTLAERPLDPKAYPQLSGDQLKPSGIVFAGSDRAAGPDPSQW